MHLSRLGLVVAVGVCAAAGDLACSKGGNAGSGPPAPSQAVPLGIVPASALMTQKYGIVQWRTFVGLHQMVVTGYRADGTASRGVQLAWFKEGAGGPGHFRLMMLDGTGTTLRRAAGAPQVGTKSLSNLQIELLSTMSLDEQRAGNSGLAASSASRKGGITLAPPGVASGVSIDTNLSIQSGANTGPQCNEAWGDPTLLPGFVGCVIGVPEAVAGGPVGWGLAALGCGTFGYQIVHNAYVCNQENAAHCQAGSLGTYYDCDWDSGASCVPTSSAMVGLKIEGMNYCPIAMDSGTGGDDDAGGDDGGGGTEGDAAAADDGGAGDDGGEMADDGGSDPTDDGGADDPSGDDGGADSDALTENDVDEASSNTTCPSCQGAGTDLNVNPNNGDVSVAGANDPSQSSSPTGDQTDPGASSEGAGGGSSSGGSGASTDPGDDNGSSSSSSGGTGDDGTGNTDDDAGASGDDGTGNGDDGGSDQGDGTQDQSAQDQASQGSQDMSLRHHRKSAWKRLLDFIWP